MTHRGLGDSYFAGAERFGPTVPPPSEPPGRPEAPDLPVAPIPAEAPVLSDPAAWREAHIRRLSLLGHFASVLIVIVAVISAGYAWASWNTHGVVKDTFTRPFDFSEEQMWARLEAADNLSLIAGWAYFAIHIAAGIVVIVWLWRARQNSEELSDGLHTRARGWVIGGWLVPIVSWWFPYQVVRDVWRASDPATRTIPGELRFVRGHGLVGWWWFFWVVTTVTAGASLRHFRDEPTDAETVDEVIGWFRTGAIYDTVSTAAEVLAAVLIVLIIRRISRWQETPVPAART